MDANTRIAQSVRRPLEDGPDAEAEPVFVLKARDLTADLIVDCWIAAQVDLRQALDDGLTIPEALAKIRRDFRLAPWSQFTGLDDPKLAGAAKIGQAMGLWPTRKVAD